MPPRYQGGGVSYEKWDDPTHNTAKYQALRILDAFPPAEARAQMKAGQGPVVDALRAAGYTVMGDDKISRSDIGTIDVIHSRNDEYGWNPDAPKVAATGAPEAVAPMRIAQGLSNPYAPLGADVAVEPQVAPQAQQAPLQMPVSSSQPALYGTSQTPTFRGLMPLQAPVPPPQRQKAGQPMTFQSLYRGVR